MHDSLQQPQEVIPCVAPAGPVKTGPTSTGSSISAIEVAANNREVIPAHAKPKNSCSARAIGQFDHGAWCSLRTAPVSQHFHLPKDDADVVCVPADRVVFKLCIRFTRAKSVASSFKRHLEECYRIAVAKGSQGQNANRNSSKAGTPSTGIYSGRTGHAGQTKQWSFKTTFEDAVFSVLSRTQCRERSKQRSGDRRKRNELRSAAKRLVVSGKDHRTPTRSRPRTLKDVFVQPQLETALRACILRNELKLSEPWRNDSAVQCEQDQNQDVPPLVSLERDSGQSLQTQLSRFERQYLSAGCRWLASFQSELSEIQLTTSGAEPLYTYTPGRPLHTDTVRLRVTVRPTFLLRGC